MLLPFLFPLLAIGALAYLANSRSRVAQASSSGGPASAALAAIASGEVPSPIAVLLDILRAGETPPEMVILAAIAEAEETGRHEVTRTIVETLIAPVVHAAEASSRVQAMSPAAMASPWAPPVYPYAAGYPVRSRPSPAPWPPHMHPMSHPMAHPMYPAHPGRHRRHHHAPHYAPAPVTYADPYGGYQPGRPVDQADPGDARWSHHHGHPGRQHPNHDEHLDAQGAQHEHALEPDSGATRTAEEAHNEAQEVLAEVARQTGQVSQVTRPDPTGDHAAQDERRRAAAPTVSGRSSPIEGVGTDEWASFVGRVSRELPTYMAARHVGRFRHRRDRLSQLGIDPDSVVGSPEAQEDALCVDMRDAYQHARASGIVDSYVGGRVDVSVDGDDRAVEVTLSGILGVVQAAGLEGAVEWLERPGDRIRFKNTTNAFLRTNGTF